MESDYTKRELDDHFTRVNERFDRQDVKLASIEDQTKKTNGRVGKLETKWAGVIMGGAVLTFLVGMIITLVVYSFQLSQDNLKNTILLELKTK